MVQPTSATPASNFSPSKLPSSSPSSARSVVSILGAAADVLTPGEE